MYCEHWSCECLSDLGIERGQLHFCSEHCASVTASMDHDDPCGCGHATCSDTEELKVGISGLRLG